MMDHYLRCKITPRQYIVLIACLVALYLLYDRLNFMDDRHEEDRLPLETRFALRRAHVQDICRQFNLDRKNSSTRMLVNKKMKFMYCELHKVGSTSFKRTLVYLSRGESIENRTHARMPINNYDFLSKNNLIGFTSLSRTEQEEALRNYTRLLIVRHPMKRLLSAFNDRLGLKFNDSDRVYFKKAYGTKIIREFRQNASEEALQTGQGVTFNEFMKYINKYGTETNVHWKSYYKDCHPCGVDYTHIMHLETFEEDSSYVLHKLTGKPHKTTGALVGPHDAQRDTYTSEDDYYRDFYKTVSANDLNKTRKLLNVDLKLFGYDFHLGSMSDGSQMEFTEELK